MFSALCSVLCAVCSVLCALCSVPRALFSVFCALCCVVCYVCFVFHALCSFLVYAYSTHDDYLSVESVDAATSDYLTLTPCLP